MRGSGSSHVNFFADSRYQNLPTLPERAAPRHGSRFSFRRVGVPPMRHFFYPGPVAVQPLAHAAIVALLGPRLRPLRTEAAGAEQPAHVVGMVADVEVVTDQVDDPPTRPQARAIAGGFRPGQDQAREGAPAAPPRAWGGARRPAGRAARRGLGVGTSASSAGPSADRRPGGRPRRARGCHAGGVPLRGVVAARAQPGSPVGACRTSHSGA
jgi:hypothetical protein